jgi:hypothetical protein
MWSNSPEGTKYPLPQPLLGPILPSIPVLAGRARAHILKKLPTQKTKSLRREVKITKNFKAKIFEKVEHSVV